MLLDEKRAGRTISDEEDVIEINQQISPKLPKMPKWRK
jgi:hypothetical protein